MAVPSDIELSPDGTQVRALIRPPLWAGLPRTLVPHSSPLLIPVLRTAGDSSLSPELTRRLIRASFELASHLPEPWKLWISDAKLVLAAERCLTASEQADAAMALQSLRRALESLVKATPIAPWRSQLVQAWTVAAAELGGRVEPDLVVLAYSRAGVHAEVRLELEAGAPTTIVRIVNELPPAEPAEGSPALGVLKQLGCELRERAAGLEVARAGLVASAPALREILEAAIDLALERAQAGGPYR